MRRYLTPRMLGAHLLVLVCLLTAGGLGVWQLDAWQTRREVEVVDLTRRDPVPLASVLGPDDPFPADSVGQPVTVEGTWLSDATVFVADRDHEGRSGYWVVTPLTSGAADDPALPVVRGWTPEPDQAPAPPTGPARVVGWLQPPEGSGSIDDDPRDDVYPQLRVADLVQRVDGDLYGAYAVVTETVGSPADISNDGTTGLEPADLAELPPPSRFTAIRNLLYAVEWWIFGAFAAFIWWRWRRDATHPEIAPLEAGVTPAASSEAAPDRVSPPPG